MAEKQNPAEPSSGQSTSKEAIQEIAQTVARELLSELKSTSTQQQDLALPSGKRSNFHSAQPILHYPCRIKRSKRCRIPCMHLSALINCLQHVALQYLGASANAATLSLYGSY